MPTATITMLFCVHEATGTDLGAIQGIAGLPLAIVPADLAGLGILEFIQGLPGVIAAIDAAGSDPDQLFMTTSTVGELENSIWPGGEETVDMRAGQSVRPDIQIEFNGSQNISLWENDLSAADHLGSVTIFASEQGQGELAKLAKSDVEHSIYYVSYIVE